MKTFIHIAGYKFITLSDLPTLREKLMFLCKDLKGTILLSEEGVNLNLSGSFLAINAFKNFMQEHSSFSDMVFRETKTTLQPYKRLKIKIKKEIITLRHPSLRPDQNSAPYVSAKTLKLWLDEKRTMTLLDTRNDYEVAIGKFEQAISLPIQDFNTFPKACTMLSADKPIVMYCTGGIRCEKASLYLLEQGFKEVYQLEGGILEYFASVGGAHFSGDCFVFDDRGALNTNLEPANYLHRHQIKG